MKKIISLGLVFGCGLMLASCGTKKNNTESSKSSETTTSTSLTPEQSSSKAAESSSKAAASAAASSSKAVVKTEKTVTKSFKKVVKNGNGYVDHISATTAGNYTSIDVFVHQQMLTQDTTTKQELMDSVGDAVQSSILNDTGTTQVPIVNFYYADDNTKMGGSTTETPTLFMLEN
jgi:hypothetical protein